MTLENTWSNKCIVFALKKIIAIISDHLELLLKRYRLVRLAAYMKPLIKQRKSFRRIYKEHFDAINQSLAFGQLI
jgi:hypothetical protein